MDEDSVFENYSFEDFFGIDPYDINERSLRNLLSSMYSLHENYLCLYNNQKPTAGYFPVKSNGQDLIFTKMEIISQIHNYVSSVYTFRECIRQESIKTLGESIKLEDTEYDFPPNPISTRLRFLYGLRIILQHGDMAVLNIEIAGNQAIATINREQYKRASAWDKPPTSVDENYLQNIPKGNINIPDQIERFHTCIGQSFLDCVESYKNQFY